MGWLSLGTAEDGTQLVVGDSAWDRMGEIMALILPQALTVDWMQVSDDLREAIAEIFYEGNEVRMLINQVYQQEWNRDMHDAEFIQTINFVMGTEIMQEKLQVLDPHATTGEPDTEPISIETLNRMWEIG